MDSIVAEARRPPGPHSPFMRLPSPSSSPGRAKSVAAPRSGRVVKPLDSSITSPPITAPSYSSPPTIPPRSPRRPPPARSATTHSSWSSSSTLASSSSQCIHQESQPTIKYGMAHNNQIDALLHSFRSPDVSTDALTIASSMDPSVKLLAKRPESPECIGYDEGGEEDLGSKLYKGRTSLDSATLVNSTSPSKPSLISQQSTTLTKREHALLELLSSERAYASDLALIRDIHMPAALGLAASLSKVPSSPPNSSNSSSRTVSSASDSSSSYNVPPMTVEDTRIIFSNVAEIAMFADKFTEDLEVALGSVLDGGTWIDSVGELFVRIAPAIEQLYKPYITRHSSALHHLQNLPLTPALQNYLTYTQNVSTSLSHAWDLASLLIKPVQRLLKYPLLLTAIIDETPEGHPDKENLRAARMTMEYVARNVNEERRRAEVVRDVLSNKTIKRANTSVGVATSVNLTKMMSIRHGGVTAASMRVAQLTDGTNNEATLVESLQADLKQIDYSAQNFAKSVVEWSRMTSKTMLALRTWSYGFSNVIGLSAEQSSEAFDAFLAVIERGLLPLVSEMDQAINDRVLKNIARLLVSMNQPLKLIESMNEQEPYHYHLLTMPVSAKNRPPPSLLTASSNYLALRGQLAAELPAYIRLLQKGIAAVIRRFANIQTRFWASVRDCWVELWEMLRAETESNLGREETCTVWRTRCEEVDHCLSRLTIMTPVHDVMTRFLNEKGAREREVLAAERQKREKLALERREKGMQAFRERDRQPEAAKIIRGMNSSRPHTLSTTPQSTPPSRGSSSSKAATVNSLFSALEPQRANKLKSMKQTPSLAERPSTGSKSPGHSARTSPPISIMFTKESEGTKRNRAFSADSVGILSPHNASQDTIASLLPSDSIRRKNDGRHGFPSSYTGAGVEPDDYGHHRVGRGRPQSQHRPALQRMQSMPLAAVRTPNASILTSCDDEYELYEGAFTDRYTHHSYHGTPRVAAAAAAPAPAAPASSQQSLTQGQQRAEGAAKERRFKSSFSSSKERPSRDKSPKKKDKEKEKEKSTSSQTRKRSGSVKSITSFFTGGNHDSSHHSEPPPLLSASQRDSWVSKKARYVCQVVHPCRPPAAVSYYSFPFFTLQEGEFYDVLQEAGHPSIHPKLPLYVDDGEDCLLLCRDKDDIVGWALASFLEPVSGP